MKIAPGPAAGSSFANRAERLSVESTIYHIGMSVHTASKIMHRAVMAAQLVNYTDDEHHRIWASFKVNWRGHAVGRSRRRQLYERIAKGESEIKQEYRRQHPIFGAAYQWGWPKQSGIEIPFCLSIVFATLRQAFFADSSSRAIATWRNPAK